MKVEKNVEIKKEVLAEKIIKMLDDENLFDKTLVFQDSGLMSKYKVELNKRCVERYVREIILASALDNESKSHSKKKI